MKFLFAMILLTVGLNAMADTVKDQLLSTTLSVAAPIAGPIHATTCKGDSCYGTLVLLPLSTVEAVSTTLVVLLKEEVVQAEPDAINFLAGEDMTLALEELLAEVRARHPELNQVNDEELVSFILSNK